jgi:hypothetical protein
MHTRYGIAERGTSVAEIVWRFNQMLKTLNNYDAGAAAFNLVI